jgi:hypothetical protein
VLLLDLLDASATLLGSLRTLVGANPLLLVATKADLLPAGASRQRLAPWLLQLARAKRLKVAGAHVVSSVTGEGGRPAAWLLQLSAANGSHLPPSRGARWAAGVLSAACPIYTQPSLLGALKLCCCVGRRPGGVPGRHHGRAQGAGPVRDGSGQRGQDCLCIGAAAGRGRSGTAGSQQQRAAAVEHAWHDAGHAARRGLWHRRPAVW